MNLKDGKMECPKCNKSVAFVCTDYKICKKYRYERIMQELDALDKRQKALMEEAKNYLNESRGNN